MSIGISVEELPNQHSFFPRYSALCIRPMNSKIKKKSYDNSAVICQ